MAATSNPLSCKNCGYANEGERVYCHNCGTKLDRSLLPPPSEPVETLAKKQRRIRKIVMPSRGVFVGAGKTLIYTVLWSMVTAAAILTLLPPDGIPPEKKKDDLLDVRGLTSELEDDIQTSAPVKVTMTEAEINDYLQYTVKPAPSAMVGDSVGFERTFVKLEEGMIRITAEGKVFNHPIYSTIYYRLGIKGDKLDATVQGGNFGRLRIHPNLMVNIAPVFGNLWAALKRDKRALDHCQSIEVHADHVDVVTVPAAQ